MSTSSPNRDQLRRDLAALEREQTRLADAVASGGGTVSILVERLRTTEAKRCDLLRQLDRALDCATAPDWRVVERQMRCWLSR